MGNRLQGRSRLGIPPALRAILDTYEKADLTDAIDFGENASFNADDRYIAFGDDGVDDSSLYFNGLDLCLKDSNTGVKTLAELAAASTMTLDEAYEQGKFIDGSGATGATNAFSVGGAAADDKVEIFHNATKATINCRAGNMDITAQGGTINFNDEALTTTGKVTADGGVEIGADSVKLTLGADDATDAYLQHDGNHLEVFSKGSIELFMSGDADDYMVFSTVSDVPTIGTAGSCDLDITSDSGEITFGDDNVTIGTGTLDVAGVATFTVAATTAGINNATNPIDTTAAIKIGADSIKLSFGVDDAADCYIEWNGDNMNFYSSAHGNVVTLDTLAGGSLSNPDVSGDLTITEGKLVWTDGQDEVAGTWTFSNVTNDGIDIIANSATTSNILHITSTSLVGGSGVLVTLAEGTLSGGYYFEGADAGTTVFGVKEDGEIEIRGAAAADMITITAGELVLSDGVFEVDISNGNDQGCYIKRADVTGTAALLEIEQSADGPTSPCLLLDMNSTGDADVLEITNAGTGFAITATGGVAGSGGFEFTTAASATAPAIDVSGDWDGAAATGMIMAASNGVLADVAASLLYAAHSGNAAGASQEGSCLNLVETGANSGTSYAAGISSTSNNAMHLVTIAVGTTNLVVDGGSGQTASMTVLDGTPANGWIGAANVGMLHLKSDGALADVAASLLHVTYTGDTDTGNKVSIGNCAYFYENGTIEAGSYAVGIKSTGGNALNVETAATDTINLNVIGITGQTESMIKLNGGTGADGWIGADTNGMIEIDMNDANLAHVNSSGLAITFSGVPQNASRGHCLRIVDTSNSGGATGYAVYVSANDAENEAMLIDSGKLDVDEEVRLNTASAGAGLGHIKIGTTADHAGAKGENVITIKNGAVKPAGAIADCASLFTEGGELEGIDSGGVETTLTPHTEEGDYVINSYVPWRNSTLRIHLEQIIDFLVEKYPEISNLVQRLEGRDMIPKATKSPKRVK